MSEAKLFGMICVILLEMLAVVSLIPHLFKGKMVTRLYALFFIILGSFLSYGTGMYLWLSLHGVEL